MLRIVSEVAQTRNAQPHPFDTTTVFGKVASLITDISSEEWVSSSFIRDVYQKRYGENISLPVISTYLSRLCKMGLLERKGGPRRLMYRLIRQNG